MQSVAERVARRIIEPLNGIEVPLQLLELIDRHRQTLIDLAQSLLSGGRSEAEVQRILEHAFESFKSDLSKAIQKMNEEANDS